MSKKVLLLVVLTAVLLLTLSGVASAVTVTTLPLTGKPQNIDISGHLVSYGDLVSPPDIFNVHVYNVTAGSDTAITSTGGGRTGITVDGDRVVWSEGGGSGIYGYSFSAPVPGGAPMAGTGTFSFMPALSGNILAYQVFNFGTTTGDVWYQNIGSASVQVTSLGNTEYTVGQDVSGNNIVWADNRNGPSDFDVFYYDTSAPHVPGGTPITSGGPIQSQARINGNNVVYVDNADGDNEIYLYPLPGGPAQKITDNTSTEYEPDISGTNIVWVNQGQIFMYDMLTSQTIQLSDGISQYYSPRIDGNHVVWLDTTDPITGVPIVYLVTIQEEVTPQPETQLPYTGN